MHLPGLPFLSVTLISFLIADNKFSLVKNGIQHKLETPVNNRDEPTMPGREQMPVPQKF